MDRPTVYHIPVCTFSQRLETLLELKGRRAAVRIEVVDITRPRDPRLLGLSGGSTALPTIERLLRGLRPARDRGIRPGRPLARRLPRPSGGAAGLPAPDREALL
jgi:hypothetical protein